MADGFGQDHHCFASHATIALHRVASARLAPRRDERYGALARNFRPSFTVGVVNVAAQQRPAAFPSWTRSGTGSGVTAAGSASRLPLPLTMTFVDPTNALVITQTGHDATAVRIAVRVPPRAHQLDEPSLELGRVRWMGLGHRGLLSPERGLLSTEAGQLQVFVQSPHPRPRLTSALP